jgi:hypothetical protein
MRDNVVINYVDIMDVVLVAGVKTGCRVIVAAQGRTSFDYLYEYDNVGTFLMSNKKTF